MNNMYHSGSRPAMKVLVTGGSGKLGKAVVERLRVLRLDCCAPSHEEMDVTDWASVKRVTEAYQPDAIIHCAAWTDVDGAEDHLADCVRVNGLGTINMTRAAVLVNARMMYISSDFVFDGKGDAPYLIEAMVVPLNIYGMSKGQGELAVRSMMERYFVVRCSWIYSDEGGFPDTILKAAATRRELRVVDDQIGAPTYAPDLAVLLCDMIRTNRYGVYNAAADGFCSRYEMACRAVSMMGLRCKVTPVATDEYTTKARRPLNSRLELRCLEDNGFHRLAPWDDQLERFVERRKLMER